MIAIIVLICAAVVALALVFILWMSKLEEKVHRHQIMIEHMEAILDRDNNDGR